MMDGAQVTDAAAAPAAGELRRERSTDEGTSVPIGITKSRKPWVRRCFKRKPLEVVHAEEIEGVMERTLGFWDLFALGFGGTVGSGVFVMTGLICHEIAGPAGILSWVVAGFGCLLSALSFAELSWRVPSAGGAYAYAFVALGELPAAIVGWCMTLEYGISGAAVAKSWGEMLSVGLSHTSEDGGSTDAQSAESASVSEGWEVFGGVLDMGAVYAAVLHTVCVVIVIGGLKASTITVNTFSIAKGLLVVFMTSTAFSIYESDNLVPFTPFGSSGVLKGAVAAFFGFLGFDEVVLLSPEAKNPAKHVPRALFASLVAVAIVCATASIALSGAAPAQELDSDSAFAEAFRDRGMKTAYKITAIGELVTLPLVVLVSFMAQPRLLYAMAKDGLLPGMFAEVDSRGTLLKGSLVSGVVCILIAAFVPFDALDNIISAGVLLAFNFVTSSLLVLRHRACEAEPSAVHPSFRDGTAVPAKHSNDESHGRVAVARVLVANFAACASALLAILTGHSQGTGAIVLVISSVVCGVAGLYVLSSLKSHPAHAEASSGGNFLSPLFPWPQAFALWVNWFLVCQLPLNGILALVAYVSFGTIHYVCYGASHSVGNCSGWASLLSTATGGLSISAIDGAEAGDTPPCLSPAADAPLLKPEEIGTPGKPSQAEMGQDRDMSPQVQVLPINSAQPPPGVAPRERLVRRRSTESR